MSIEITNRATVLRAEIERIKGTILLTRDLAERATLYERLGICMSEYLLLVDQRLHQPIGVSKPLELLQERQLGE